MRDPNNRSLTRQIIQSPQEFNVHSTLFGAAPHMARTIAATNTRPSTTTATNLES
jgi:hypothetical protein